MSSLASNPSDVRQFFNKGLHDFDRNASFFPSSRFLVRRLLENAPLAGARCVVELGAGTGVVTRGILQRLPADAHLHAVEIDGELCQATARATRDQRLEVVHGDARHLARHLGSCQPEAIVSSLGLSLLEPPVRRQVLAAAARVLAPAGVFTQYSYVTTRVAVYSPAHRRWSRFHARPHLEAHFDRVSTALVVLNLWPAMVYTCTQAA
jgi:phospholipid N-methyltransferase